MPLPTLGARAYKAEDANAREYRKRVLLGELPESAAAAVGGPVSALERNESGQLLARAIEPSELDLLRGAPKEQARHALETREGRLAWLEGVIHGDVKAEGAFGNRKEFPPAVRTAAHKLLMQAHGDLVHRVQVDVTENVVHVFRIPDNGRVPESIVECDQSEPETVQV